MKNLRAIVSTLVIVLFAVSGQTATCTSSLDQKTIEYQAGREIFTIDIRKDIVSFLSKESLEQIQTLLKISDSTLREHASQGLFTIELGSQGSAILKKLKALQKSKKISHVTYAYQSQDTYSWNDGESVFPLLFSDATISVRFEKQLSAAQLKKFMKDYNLASVVPNKFVKSQYLFTVNDTEFMSHCYLETTRLMEEQSQVVFASPNFARRKP